MSLNLSSIGGGGQLPERFQKVVDTVAGAGEAAGTVAGAAVGAPMAFATKGIASLCGKSSTQSDAMATQVFNTAATVGRVVGKVAPVAVLAAPLVLMWKLSRRD